MVHVTITYETEIFSTIWIHSIACIMYWLLIKCNVPDSCPKSGERRNTLRRELSALYHCAHHTKWRSSSISFISGIRVPVWRQFGGGQGGGKYSEVNGGAWHPGGRDTVARQRRAKRPALTAPDQTPELTNWYTVLSLDGVMSITCRSTQCRGWYRWWRALSPLHRRPTDPSYPLAPVLLPFNCVSVFTALLLSACKHHYHHWFAVTRTSYHNWNHISSGS